MRPRVAPPKVRISTASTAGRRAASPRQPCFCARGGSGACSTAANASRRVGRKQSPAPHDRRYRNATVAVAASSGWSLSVGDRRVVLFARLAAADRRSPARGVPAPQRTKMATDSREVRAFIRVSLLVRAGVQICAGGVRFFGAPGRRDRHGLPGKGLGSTPTVLRWLLVCRLSRGVRTCSNVGGFEGYVGSASSWANNMSLRWSRASAAPLIATDSSRPRMPSRSELICELVDQARAQLVAASFGAFERGIARTAWFAARSRQREQMSSSSGLSSCSQWIHRWVAATTARRGPRASHRRRGLDSAPVVGRSPGPTCCLCAVASGGCGAPRGRLRGGGRSRRGTARRRSARRSRFVHRAAARRAGDWRSSRGL